MLEVRPGRSSSEIGGSSSWPLRVRLGRSGGGAVTDGVVVRSAGGEVLGSADVRWSEGATELLADVQVRASGDEAMIVQVAPDAQPLDDASAISGAPTREPRVLVLGRRSSDGDIENLPASTWIQRALEASGLHPQEADPATLALRTARDIDAIVLCRPDLIDGAGWTWIARFVQDGGSLLLMPTAATQEQAWFAPFMRSIGRDGLQMSSVQQGRFRLAARQPRVSLLSLLGAEIDALAEPVTCERRWPLAMTGEMETVLKFEDGSVMAAMTRPREGSGVVTVLATAPELACTDLPLKPLMVPLMQEIVRGGRWLAAADQEVRAGDQASFGPAAAGGLMQPISAATAISIELDADGRTDRPIPAPGLWKLRMRDGRDRTIAVRLDPQAARIDAVSDAALQSWRSALGPWSDPTERGAGDAITSDQATAWTPWMLAAALGLLMLEMALGRRASPRTSSPGSVAA